MELAWNLISYTAMKVNGVYHTKWGVQNIIWNSKTQIILHYIAPIVETNKKGYIFF